MLALLIVAPAHAQKFAEADKSPMDIAMLRSQDKTPEARIIYSRPAMNGREIFGKLIPFDEVWRAGANESTEVTLYNDMMIGDKKVNAGTYTMYTIPGQQEWTVILNKDVNTWGAYGYKQERDVVRIKAPVRKADAPIEMFSIVFEPNDSGADLLMGWEQSYIKVPFKTVM
ncbi:MAG: DUF2911 domain-containing protein [Leeuwenhoekiella sp.]